MKYCIVCIVILLGGRLYSQSYSIDVSIATDTFYSTILHPSIGYSFSDKDYVFIGLQYQVYSIVPKKKRDEYDGWSSYFIHTNQLDAGVRYILPIFRTKKHTIDEKTFGLMTQAKLFYNPFIPRKLKYVNSLEEKKVAKGKYDYQLGYTIGGGIYLKELDSRVTYVSLLLEYSSIDAFKTLRSLQYDNKTFHFPEKGLYSIGLSIFFK